MNFKNIINAVMNKCNVDNDDIQAIDIIKLGINEAYGEIAKKEKLTATTPVIIMNGIGKLPDDLLEVVQFEPALNKGDSIKGSSLFTEHEKSIQLTYTYLPEDLVEDEEEPEISLKYHKLLVAYGCFSYFQFKKKNDIANSYFASYNRGLSVFEGHYNPENIIEVFSL